MGSVDWSARPDQIEGLALREVTVNFSSLNSVPDPNDCGIEIFYCYRTLL